MLFIFHTDRVRIWNVLESRRSYCHVSITVLKHFLAKKVYFYRIDWSLNHWYMFIFMIAVFVKLKDFEKKSKMYFRNVFPILTLTLTNKKLFLVFNVEAFVGVEYRVNFLIFCHFIVWTWMIVIMGRGKKG